jgi:hypothetical protein
MRRQFEATGNALRTQFIRVRFQDPDKKTLLAAIKFNRYGAACDFQQQVHDQLTPRV